jgi:gpW
MYWSGPPRRIPPEFIGVDPVTLQAWLTAAQLALQQLSLGQNPNSVAYAQGNGSKSVGYQQSDIGMLEQRIDTLAYALGLAPRRRAMRPGF